MIILSSVRKEKKRKEKKRKKRFIIIRFTPSFFSFIYKKATNFFFEKIKKKLICSW